MRKIHLKLLVNKRVRELKDLSRGEIVEGLCACNELKYKLEEELDSKKGAD